MSPTRACYNIYRLQIDSVANPPAANSVQLDEIQLIGPPVYSYWWSFGDGATSTAQNPQHTYTNTGNYLVILGVTCGGYSGTNTAAHHDRAAVDRDADGHTRLGATPLTVQFTGQAAGGNGSRASLDTTDDQRGIITAQGNNPPNETCLQCLRQHHCHQVARFRQRLSEHALELDSVPVRRRAAMYRVRIHRLLGQRRAGARPRQLAPARLERRRGELGDAGCAD